MPVVALALFAVFAALGFGWRSWEQWRRTGSTGFRGVSERPGSAESFAGVGFVVARRSAVLHRLPHLRGTVADHGALLSAIAGHVVARGVLTGTYER
jgi:hypothetical protein